MIKLLIVNESQAVIDAIKGEIADGKLSLESTSTTELGALSQHLQERGWDAIVTGYTFNPMQPGELIAKIRETNLYLPIIVVTTNKYAQDAINLMKQGLIRDYINQNQLTRLTGVLVREKAQRDQMRFQRRLEQKFQYLSYHDPLTSVLNRIEFENSLNEAIRHVVQWNRQYVLIIVDIYQFKLINDTCGHQAGDLLLIDVAKVLKTFAEGNGWLARIGGDEFALLLQVEEMNAAMELARQIKTQFKTTPFRWQGQTFDIEVSIGLSLIDSAEFTAQEHLTCANAACHASKYEPTERIKVFHPTDRAFDAHRADMRWPQKIKTAIEQDQFTLFHQPMANLQFHSLQHTEFLLRLKSEDRLLSPAEFIPAAERYRMMPQVDLWVIRHVFEHIRTCRKNAIEMMCFINLSGSSISDAAFFTEIKTLQQSLDIDPGNVCFEITETAAIDRISDAVDFINDIRERGFKFALDDFGAGLSSFSYLKSIPVDYLKIDGSFVRNLLENPIDYSIVEACNRVAHAAGLRTIAEFVETQAQRKAITDIGVDYAQGYGIMKPGPLSVITP